MFRTLVDQPLVEVSSDLSVTVEGTVSEGDQLVVLWTAKGTCTGVGIGLPLTGRAIARRGMMWIRFAGGQGVAGWGCWNQRERIESLR